MKEVTSFQKLKHFSSEGRFSEVFCGEENPGLLVKKVRRLYTGYGQFQLEYNFSDFKNDTVTTLQRLMNVEYGISPFIPPLMPVWGQLYEKPEGFIVTKKVEGTEIVTPGKNRLIFSMTQDMAKQVDALIAASLNVAIKTADPAKDYLLYADIFSLDQKQWGGRVPTIHNLMIGRIDGGLEQPWLIDIYPAKVWRDSFNLDAEILASYDGTRTLSRFVKGGYNFPQFWNKFDEFLSFIKSHWKTNWDSSSASYRSIEQVAFGMYQSIWKEYPSDA